ncbi:hypothetical protein BC342_05045 [Streptomyces olivaceus]|nr:hypothetical protein BC342_05045 [Streptomyces olivaceus]
MDDTVAMFDTSSSPPSPTTRPSNAVSRGSPAARSEPKVTRSTTTATARPITSPIPTSRPAVL